MRDNERCRQTISKGEVNFRFISVAQLCNFIAHEHKLYKFAYFVPLNHGKSFVRILKRDSVQYQLNEYISASLSVILNEMSILRTLITQEFSTFQFALRLTDNHRILLSARRTPSAALESNLNRLIHFSHIVINARSILSLKLRYISFLKDQAQRTKQICIRYG